MLSNNETRGSKFGGIKSSFVIIIMFSLYFLLFLGEGQGRAGEDTGVWRSLVSLLTRQASPRLSADYLTFSFLIFLVQEGESHWDIDKDEYAINQFSAFVWQSVIRRRAEINELAAALRMLAVNDLSMKLLCCDAHWPQTTQCSIVRNQVGGGGE